MPLSHFDEKSGIVAFKTSWGSWWQTVDEVHITINLPNNTKSKDVKVKISANRIECIVHGNIVFMVSFIACHTFLGFIIKKKLFYCINNLNSRAIFFFILTCSLCNKSLMTHDRIYLLVARVHNHPYLQVCTVFVVFHRLQLRLYMGTYCILLYNLLVHLLIMSHL